MMNYNRLKSLFSNSIKEFAPEIANTFELWCDFDNHNPGTALPTFDGGVTAEAVFEFYSPFPFFGEEIAMVVNVQENTATLAVIFGRFCTDPVRASKYAERFLHTPFATEWGIDPHFGKTSSLTLITTFSFADEDALRHSLSARLKRLKEDELVNELRPFIHYFDC